eukprot:2497984-Amphidinium_carterae.3
MLDFSHVDLSRGLWVEPTCPTCGCYHRQAVFLYSLSKGTSRRLAKLSNALQRSSGDSTIVSNLCCQQSPVSLQEAAAAHANWIFRLLSMRLCA